MKHRGMNFQKAVDKASKLYKNTFDPLISNLKRTHDVGDDQVNREVKICVQDCRAESPASCTGASQRSRRSSPIWRLRQVNHPIAAQLGLPAWLVKVRYAATHEELPSLEVLREATHEVVLFLPFTTCARF